MLYKCISCGHKVAESAQRCPRCGEVHPYGTGAGGSSEPLFIIRKWFPNLFPWSEGGATEVLMGLSFYGFILFGILGGCFFGYQQAGVGAAIFLI